MRDYQLNGAGVFEAARGIFAGKFCGEMVCLGKPTPNHPGTSSLDTTPQYSLVLVRFLKLT